MQSLGVQAPEATRAASGLNAVPSGFVVELASVGEDGETTVIATGRGHDA